MRKWEGDITFLKFFFPEISRKFFGKEKLKVRKCCNFLKNFSIQIFRVVCANF